jgi:adenylate cyclase
VLRAEIIDPNIAQHRGRIVKTTGDGLARRVRQRRRCGAMRRRGATGIAGAAAEPPERRIQFSVGINVGDVLADGDDFFWATGVNIAAPWKASHSPTPSALSAAAYEQVRGKLDLAVADMGEQDSKNIAPRSTPTAPCWRQEALDP